VFGDPYEVDPGFWNVGSSNGQPAPQGYEEVYNLPPSIAPDMSVKSKSFAADGREFLLPLVIGLLALLALVGKD